MPLSLFLAAAAAVTGAPDGDILVTAALEPVPTRDVAASATVIDETRIDALGQPFALDLIRLVPGVSVATNGARGSLSQIRIRGAEANHTLLFIDGIAFNDPAAGNEARFETLSAAGLQSIEIVRGPQSALWGSEAIGGVIAVSTPEPGIGTRLAAIGEYGSRNFAQASAALASGSENAGISATAGWARSDGNDIFGGGTGDLDGFENITLSVKGVVRPGGDGELGVVGRYVRADSEFDGSDPVTFLRADSKDSGRIETWALRAWGRLGLGDDAPWSVSMDAQYVDSSNGNFDADIFSNATHAQRVRVSGQLVHRFAMGPTRHSLIVQGEREDEEFATQGYAASFFVSDQHATRGRNSIVSEWRGEWGDLVSTDIAVRHDAFNRFADATSLRGGVLIHVNEAIGIFANYGEGIAQPTFFDLYGFDPDNFIGNPNLQPEKSRGYEAGIRWTASSANLQLAAFRNHLRDEIATDFSAYPLTTSVNLPGKSLREGIEISGEVQPLKGLRLSANYTYLNSRTRSTAGSGTLPALRRPKHSANLAFDYSRGPLTMGGAISYVGKRRDTDFDIFSDVTLDSYVLTSARVAYAITPALEAFARIENAFDEKYQDVVGYATPGRTVYAGLRVRLGD